MTKVDGLPRQHGAVSRVIAAKAQRYTVPPGITTAPTGSLASAEQERTVGQHQERRYHAGRGRARSRGASPCRPSPLLLLGPHRM